MTINQINFIMLPLVGAFIGYLTNWIAVKLLFWPKKPVFGIQGVVPKRKQELAKKIADSSELLLPEQIEKITKIPIIGKKVLDYIKKGVEKKVGQMDNKKLQRLIESTIKKELAFIKLSGGILGFAIGIIQAVFLEML